MIDETEERAGYHRGADTLPPGENPTDGPPVTSSGDAGQPTAKELSSTEWLLGKARDIYRVSTDYCESNIFGQWEINLAHFNSQHAAGTNYAKKDFRRSRLFRPKTRSGIKKAEAALAMAAFSTMDLVSIEAEDQRDQIQVISAAVTKEILQYRLSRRMPWYQTVMGAYQDTKVYGLCISHQYWRYSEDTEIVPAFNEDGTPVTETDPETGEVSAMGEERTRVRVDDLSCDLVEPENFRFDPMCDWRDPAGTSPFIVLRVPIYAGEALEMMQQVSLKGNASWHEHSLSELLATSRSSTDRVKQAREGDRRVNPSDNSGAGEFTTLWAHMNIVRLNGDDIVFWTMGTELLLTDPVLLQEAYPWLRQNERPFRVGFSSIEAHRNYPASDSEQSAGLQTEINAVANQRMDNVKLVLNKRYYVRRGSQVDLDALMRNVPGGGVMMSDTERDVKTVDTRDVTSSSYQEQDRLATEFDEIVGGFNAQAAAGAKAGVGGMSMMGAAANAVQDLSIKNFFETWMEPVLDQLVRLVQMYETDKMVLAFAAKRVPDVLRYGQDTVTDAMLTDSVLTRINVGMGNTDPMRRVERLIFGITKAAELPGMVDRIKAINISDEIFGAMGYKDGSRFFMNDEEFEAKQKEAGPKEPPPEIALKQRELDIREEDNKLRHQREQEKLQVTREVEYSKMADAKGVTVEKLQHGLGVERMKDKTKRDLAAIAEINKARETTIKQATAGLKAVK